MVHLRVHAVLPERAYTGGAPHLKYQNKRADYLKAWWNVVRWDKVAERYQKARG